MRDCNAHDAPYAKTTTTTTMTTYHKSGKFNANVLRTRTRPCMHSNVHKYSALDYVSSGGAGVCACDMSLGHTLPPHGKHARDRRRQRRRCVERQKHKHAPIKPCQPSSRQALTETRAYSHILWILFGDWRTERAASPLSRIYRPYGIASRANRFAVLFVWIEYVRARCLVFVCVCSCKM